MLKTSSETTFYDFFRPSKQKLWKNQRFLTSPRCNSAPPKGPKPCKKRCFWTQGAKSTVNYRVFWQNRAMYNVFFIFGRFSLAGKLPKWPKIPFQYPLALRYPKILEKSRKHHQGLVSVRNRLWAPPPAKADIAAAILTNVIEHLVLLLPPNKHAFTAKAVWADLFMFIYLYLHACIHAYIHACTDTQTHRYIDTQVRRFIDTEMHRCTGAYTDT